MNGLGVIAWTKSGETPEWGSVEYTYNTAGRVTTITPDGGDLDCLCEIDLTYDVANNYQLTTKDSIHAGEFTYLYDGAGRNNGYKYPDRLGTAPLNRIDYTLDVAGRVTAVNSTLHSDVDLTYNKANQLTKILFDFVSFDPKVDYIYNTTTGRLSDIDFTPSGTARGLEYGYNNDGLITGMTHSLGASEYPVRYVYDGLNRLVRETGQELFASEKCIRLNGSQTVTVATTATNDLGEEQEAFSVEARVLLEAYPSSEAVIFERGASGSENWFKLYIDSNGYLSADVETVSNPGSVNWPYPLPLNQWVHVAATYHDDWDTIRLYFNNYKVGESVLLEEEISNFSGNPKIGTGLIGKIDEVHVRSDAPTSFNPDTVDQTKVAATLGLWHFDEGTGTSVADDDTAGQTQAASLPSSEVWDNAQNEGKPAIYMINYEYDKVGNRTAALKFWRDGTPTSERWTYSYNDLNQLTQRNLYSALYGTGVTNKWVYTYDDNGNMTVMSKQTGAGVQVEKWLYEWNPRNQLSEVEKRTGTGAGTYAGKVEYEYCLSCDGALAQRKEYDTSVSTKLKSHKRYEYDGLNLLRVDERCDANGNEEIEAGETTWRAVEVNTYRPGSISALLAKRVYSYPATPDRCVSNGHVNTNDRILFQDQWFEGGIASP